MIEGLFPPYVEKSWPLSKLIEKGPAGYRDMAVLSDKTILLVNETGKKRLV